MPPCAIGVATALRTRGPWHDGTTPTWTGSHFTRPPSPGSSLLRMSRPWSSMPVSCPQVASTPLALLASGTVAIAARKKGVKSRRWLGSISRVTAPTASVWSRHHQALIPLRRRPPAWMSLWTNAAGWSRRMTEAACVPWAPMALTANSNASLACWTWGCPRWARCEPMPICVISLRGPSAQGQVAKR